MNAMKHSRPADPPAAAAVAPDADARAMKILKERLWHFTSIGLGNCRAAQKVRGEIEQRQQAEALTNSAAARTREPSTLDPQPLALLSVEQLTAGLSHLVSVGLANTRAAQKISYELRRRITLNSQLFIAPKLSEGRAALNQFRLANANFNPKEPRDKFGKWTTEDNGAGSSFSGPAQKSTSIPPDFKITPPKMPWEGFHGTEADYMALHPGDPFFSANKANQPDTSVIAEIGKGFVKLGKMLSGGLADLGETITGNPTHENISAAIHGEPMPMEAESRFLPTPLRIIERGSQGLVESAPKMAAVAGLQAAGLPAPAGAALVFGTTEHGFDPKQALIAAALPFIGKYTGALTEAIASKAGVSSATALQALNKLGGAAGAAALISADQLAEIMKLPPDKRKDALIEAAANVGSTFLLGMLGERKSSETENVQGGERTGTSNVKKTVAVHRVVTPGRPQFQLREGEQGLSVFDSSRVSPGNIVPHFREGSQIATKTISEIESHGLKVEKTPGDAKLPKHLQDAHMEIRPGPGMERPEFKRAIKKLEPKSSRP